MSDEELAQLELRLRQEGEITQDMDRLIDELKRRAGIAVTVGHRHHQGNE